MNIVREINQVYTYPEIARRILEKTGRVYSVGHLGNIARGHSVVNDKLLYNLERAFPEFFNRHQATDKDNLSESVEVAHS